MNDEILKRIAILSVSSLLLVTVPKVTFAQAIYGFERASTFNTNQHGPYSIYAGTFRSKHSAYQLKSKIAARTRYPVHVTFNGRLYVVVLGPLSSPKAVREVGRSMMNASVLKTNSASRVSYGHYSKELVTYSTIPNQPEEKKTRMFPSIFSISDADSSVKWLLSAQIGGQIENLNSSPIRVENGSGLESPFNNDVYTITNPSMATLLGVSAGVRWVLSNKLFQAFSLSAQYQYFFSSDVTGQVIQFNPLEFTNYNYRWAVSSNLLFANGKLSFKGYRKLFPYVTGGVGGVANSGKYTETALNDVIPRISPNYKGNSIVWFAYNVGAGLEYQFNPKFIVSAGYQYTNLGTLSSGQGTGTWSSESLNFGRYQSNAFLFSLTYLFDINIPSGK